MGLSDAPRYENLVAVETIRVMLAEDHTVVRQGLRRILEADPEIAITGEAGDGRTAVETARKLRPNVVLMDIGLPVQNGIEATREITAEMPDVHVCILSMHSDDVYLRHALEAGAKGYLLKDADDLELLEAIKAVARGGAYFTTAVLERIVAPFTDKSKRNLLKDPLLRLTGREREVLQLTAEGKTKAEIATILSLSVNTVDTHRKHVMEKLDVHNTAEIVRFAVRKGLVQ
jgi:two-component system response regulator NreC